MLKKGMEGVDLGHGLYGRVEEITPEMAARYLALSKGNRYIQQRRVDQYAEDMIEDRWYLTGEAILFNEDGELLGGNHRLHACVQSGTTFKTLVLRGIPSEGRYSLDIGYGWRLVHFLQAEGYKSCTALSSTIGWYWRYNNDDAWRWQEVPTVRELRDFFDEHKGLIESAQIGERVRRFIHLPGSILGGMHYEANHVLDAEEDAEFFFDKLASGEELGARSPILALRRWSHERSKSVHDRTQARLYAAVAIKTWNLYREGQEVDRVGFRSGGAKPETFPKMI